MSGINAYLSIIAVILVIIQVQSQDHAQDTLHTAKKHGWNRVSNYGFDFLICYFN